MEFSAELRYPNSSAVYPVSTKPPRTTNGPMNQMWGYYNTTIPRTYWSNSGVYFMTIGYKFKGWTSEISQEWIYQP
jgi:hypothetical protein